MAEKFTPDEMRRRFHELGAERARILAQSAPVREKRDELRAMQDRLRREMAPLIEEIRRIEAGLFELDNERGALARALNGKTGRPD